MFLAPGSTILKDPDSVEPRGFDWTEWLAEFDTTELITASTWVVTGADAILTLSNPSIVIGSLKTQVKLTAGTAGVIYKVTNSVTTTSGYKDDRSFFVLMKDR